MYWIFTAVFVAGLVAVAGGLTCSKLMIERLLQFQYKQYHDDWCADGRPRDYHIPRISRFSSDGPESPGALKAWIRNLWFKTPAWIAAEPACQRWLRSYRIASIIAFLAVIGPLLLLALYCAWG